MLEYPNITSHNVLENNTCEQNNMENMETYSNEVDLGNKKVHITLEFPYTVDPKDAERFERCLRQIYLGKIQLGARQKSLSALESSSQVGEEPMRGGKNNE